VCVCGIVDNVNLCGSSYSAACPRTVVVFFVRFDVLDRRQCDCTNMRACRGVHPLRTRVLLGTVTVRSYRNSSGRAWANRFPVHLQRNRSSLPTILIRGFGWDPNPRKSFCIAAIFKNPFGKSTFSVSKRHPRDTLEGFRGPLENGQLCNIIRIKVRSPISLYIKTSSFKIGLGMV